MKRDRSTDARRLKRILVESSPLIEEMTSAVCPGCSDVCCRQKHGRFREADVRYLEALGEEVPERDRRRPPEGPCERMGPQGCRDPRWMRPFRCTWYFCEPLIASLNNGPQKKARQLTAAVREMVGLYDLFVPSCSCEGQPGAASMETAYPARSAGREDGKTPARFPDRSPSA